MNSSPTQSSEVPEPSPPRRPQAVEQAVSPPTPSMSSVDTDLNATVELTAPNPPAPVPSAGETSLSPPEPAAMREQPIPPPSEPMQYRAIGLVRGKYVPSEEQFTRGNLYAEDGTDIDAVLLGRVMSLVKNHLDLEQPHLWVVYPRTRQNDDRLHVQIVGVWEPEKLNRDPACASGTVADESVEESGTVADEPVEEAGTVADEPVEESGAVAEESVEESGTSAVEESETNPDEGSEANPDEGSETNPDEGSDVVSDVPALRAPPSRDKTAESEVASTEQDENFFSIRGEVVNYSKDEKQVVVKIKQAPRKEDGKVKFFKLKLEGVLGDRATGYFWDLRVHREANSLMIKGGNSVALVPPKKKSKKYRGGGGRPPGRRPSRGGYAPARKGMRPAPAAPVARKEGAPKKPIIKRRDRTSSSEGGTTSSSS